MRRALAVVGLLVAVSACRGEGAVQRLTPDELPPDLFGESAQVSDPTDANVAMVFLVSDGRLEAVSRAGAGSRPEHTFAIRQLLAGPTDEEIEAGLRTAIASDVELLGVTVDQRVASVNLSREFERPASRDVRVLRLAQVVYTMTALTTVDSVTFRIDGAAVQVIDQDGRALDTVNRARYASVGPEADSEVGEGSISE